LTGIEAITAANGWGMAILGASIVFAGLVALSSAISLIHKVLELFETKESPMDPFAGDAGNPEIPDRCPADITQTARLYQPLIDKLNEPFDLVRLYQLSRERGYPHPHLTIKCLQEADILVPAGDGYFTWHLK
jgi:hypothetical protein